MQPTLALHIALRLMMMLYRQKDWSACFHMLLRLVTEDLEPPWENLVRFPPVFCTF